MGDSERNDERQVVAFQRVQSPRVEDEARRARRFNRLSATLLHDILPVS